MAKKPAKLIKADTDVSVEAQPQYKVEYREIQPYGTLKKLPIALEDNARAQSVATLNQVLADTMTIRDMYKKHHWQMSGATFYQLHLCSTSIMKSRQHSSISSPNASWRLAVSRSRCRTMSRR